MATYSTPASPALHPAPPPLPSAPAPTARLTRALVAPMVVFFFTTCALGVTAVITPKFEEIFRDFGVALPYLTRVFISLGRALTTPFGIVSAAAVVLLLCLASAGLSYSRRGVFVLVLILAVGGFLLYMGIFALAMFWPNATMVESLQQSAPQP